MPGIWTADDVLFAPFRARRGNARELAHDLLEAADTQSRLDSVTPAQARICAAQILFTAGDLDAALMAAHQGLAEAAPPDLGPRERFSLAELYVATGDADRAVDLAAGALTGGQVGYQLLGGWIALVLQLATAGQFEHALQLCDAAKPRSGAPVHRGLGALGSRIGQLMELTRQQVLAIKAEADGSEPSIASATPSLETTRADAAESPAWPAVVDGHLGWWPEPDYVRITRQVPELTDVLGYPWRQHTQRTESALRASSRRGERGLRLVALTFAGFADYLVATPADPGSAAVMTDFAGTKPLWGHAWPPKDRRKCWCGSGQRYRDCCGRYR